MLQDPEVLESKPEVIRIPIGAGTRDFYVDFLFSAFNSSEFGGSATILTRDSTPPTLRVIEGREVARIVRVEPSAQVPAVVAVLGALRPARDVALAISCEVEFSTEIVVELKGWNDVGSVQRRLRVEVENWHSTLLVPTGLHALVLNHDTTVAAPTMDFSRMPHRNSYGDQNAETPFLGCKIATPPLSDRTITLRAGVHLHWTMPGALRRGSSSRALAEIDLVSREVEELEMGSLPASVWGAMENLSLSSAAAEGVKVQVLEEGKRWILADRSGNTLCRLRARIKQDPTGSNDPPAKLRCVLYGAETQFPEVPNRWLVARSGPRPRRWIVESDYLWPNAGTQSESAIAWPVMDRDGAVSGLRRMGRVVQTSAATDLPPEGSGRVDRLTAVGHGDPVFASYYPNCRSVFGFHDDDVHPEELADTHYDVIGWYADPARDFLATPHIRDLLETSAQRHGIDLDGRDTRRSSIDTLKFDVLKTELGWHVNWLPAAGVSERMLCYARLRFPNQSETTEAPREEPVKLAVGNTATEAMSAYIATETRARGEFNMNELSVEEQIEAMQMSSLLEGQQNQFPLQFRGAKHRHSFAAVEAGRYWWIGAVSRQTSEPGGTADVPVTGVLPQGADDAIDAVNSAERILQAARDRSDAEKDQLFADWHAYLDLAFSDIGNRPSGAPAEADLAQNLRRKANRLSGADHDQIIRLEIERDAAVVRLDDLLKQHNAEHLERRERLVLRQSPAPRFWRPRDPMLLISGGDLAKNLHDSVEKKLTCRTIQTHDALPNPTEIQGLMDEMEAEGAQGFHHYDKNVRRDFMVEWRARLQPEEGVGANAEGRISQNALRQSYGFDPDGTDVLRHDTVPIRYARRGHTVTGRAILTAGNDIHFEEKLRTVLDKAIKRLMADNLLPEQPDDDDDGFKGRLLAALGDRRLLRAHPLVFTLATAYEHFFRENKAAAKIVFVALGGLNDAMTMRSRGPQLPVFTPLGFASETKLAEDVRCAIGRLPLRAPLPEAPFNPLRAARMELEDVVIADCFGRTRNLNFQSRDLRAPTAMKEHSSSEGALHLRPRLLQPARLRFRWLASRGANVSDSSDREVNDASETSPVCGWLMQNHMDGRLGIYAADGALLGELDGSGMWFDADGQSAPLPNVTPDPALRRVLHSLHSLAPENGLERIRSKLAGITPETEAGLPAFLAGRPMAVVRATLAFDIKGLPMAHQGWDTLARSVAHPNAPRANGNIGSVVLPVRVGDFGLLDDGLVAFWEDPATPSEIVAASEACFDETERIVNLKLDGTPRTLTFLMDPRGAVHAATGLLPQKRIFLPTRHWKAALARLDTRFDVGPLLVGSMNALPVALDPGISWIWQEKGPNGNGRVERPMPPDPNAWAERQTFREGRLAALPKNKGDDTVDG